MRARSREFRIFLDKFRCKEPEYCMLMTGALDFAFIFPPTALMCLCFGPCSVHASLRRMDDRGSGLLLFLVPASGFWAMSC